MRLALSAEVETESDVEQKIVFPLLNSPDFLGVPSESIKTKNYLCPSALDKAAGRKMGYYPDYSVWISGYPILVAEAKVPKLDAAVGYREASLYARHLNSQYMHSLNPCQVIVATNGVRLLAGYWDADKPTIDELVDDIRPGTLSLERFRLLCGVGALEKAFADISKQLDIRRAFLPAGPVGGQTLLNSKRPLNSFAAELSPVLRRFFSSNTQTDVRLIAERAYVSSGEITEYDRVLESLLRDRVSARRDTIVQPIQTNKNNEPKLTRAISDFSSEQPPSGQLQIIQGGVGVGKSLFARRYREFLQPSELAKKNYWAFVDFNAGPPSLNGAEAWLCEQFVSSFAQENPRLDLYDEQTLRGVFSRKIQSRKGVYSALNKVSQAEANRARALDLASWQTDAQLITEGLGNYIGGVTKANLIVVMDNVDRLDLTNQLDAFQLALWFMGKTRSFVIIQMRDETYERYKSKPPLDTFRTGIAFHISPPRFIDVVKKRLELGIEYLAANTAKTQEFILDNGYKMVVPSSELGTFLHRLYIELFGKRRNVARVLEALAGSDVRRALEMFVSIVTSGHLSTSTIASNVLGEGGIPLAEFHIIRILMRTDYRFFSENSGYITNLFFYDENWARADNFLLAEILYYLSMSRRQRGPLGLEGYIDVSHVCDKVEQLGYPRLTVFQGVNYLLKRQLIGADDFNFTHVTEKECVKVQASGFIHLRVLCERLEYLYGVLPSTPITDRGIAKTLAKFLDAENQQGSQKLRDSAQAVAMFERYLKTEFSRLRERNPFYVKEMSGTQYILRCMQEALRRYYHRGSPAGQNELDLV